RPGSAVTAPVTTSPSSLTLSIPPGLLPYQSQYLPNQLAHRLRRSLRLTRDDGIRDFLVICHAREADAFAQIGHANAEAQRGTDELAQLREEPVAARREYGDMKGDVRFQRIVLTPFGRRHALQRLLDRSLLNGSGHFSGKSRGARLDRQADLGELD